MSRHDLMIDVRDDAVELFLERLENLTGDPAAFEQAQVAAAVRAVTSPAPLPRRVPPAPRHRVLPRRVPVASLSALSALLAGIPAKAALAAAAALVATTGLAVSGHLPQPAVDALRSGAEKAGVTVEEPGADQLPASQTHPDAGTGNHRSGVEHDPMPHAASPADPAARKAAGLRKAADAPGSQHARAHKAAGLAKAAAGADNASRRPGAHGAARDHAAPTSHRHPPVGPASKAQGPPHAVGNGNRVPVPLPVAAPATPGHPRPALRTPGLKVPAP